MLILSNACVHKICQIKNYQLQFYSKIAKIKFHKNKVLYSISHCLQISLPESVTGRYNHSLTAITMSPNCVWLVIIGGSDKFLLKDVGGGLKQAGGTQMTDTNRQIMIVELGMRIVSFQLQQKCTFLFQYMKLVSG